MNDFSKFYHYYFDFLYFFYKNKKYFHNFYLLNQYLTLLPEQAGEKQVTPAMINNYVKLKIIPPPVKKRYNREHLAQLVILCVLKQVLSVSAAAGLIRDFLALMPMEAIYDHFVDFTSSSLPTARERLADGFFSGSDRQGKWEYPLMAALFCAVEANTGRLMAGKHQRTKN